jgi:hypothetical protein
MIKRCLQLFAPASACAALVLAQAGSQAAVPASTYLTFRSEAAQTLIGRGDAESLATAAALSFAGASVHPKADLAAQKSAAVELAAKSNELDPENPSIGWLRLQLCANTPGCDIRDAATSMRWVDADNGAAWMATLAVAQKDKDTVEVDRILTDMAQGVRFDLYWNRTVVLLFDALRKARSALPARYLPSDVARLGEAIAVAGAEIIPPFTPLLNACRDPAGAERRENCLKLSKIMQRGDTVAAQLAGFSLERRLSPAESKETRAIADRRRVLEWRVSTAGQIEEPVLPWLKNAHARARIAEMRAMPREEDVDIAILREHKMPLEPPAVIGMPP